MPYFSVIIPTHNRLGLLKHAIGSVEKQTCKDYELIIVDDGSTDGTADYLDHLPAIVISQHNEGPAAARNVGARHANGCYLIFLDSDDLLYPWALSTYAAVLGNKRNIILGASMIEFSTNPSPASDAPLFVQHFDGFLQTSRDPKNFAAGNLVIDKDLFLDLGGFDETFQVAEDADFYLRAGTRSPFVRISSPPTIAYRVHSSNMWREPYAVGVLHLLQREKAGGYPGGVALRKNRYALLTRASRSASLDCLNYGHLRPALKLYSNSFLMNLRLRRFKYLAGFLTRFPTSGVTTLLRAFYSRENRT